MVLPVGTMLLKLMVAGAGPYVGPPVIRMRTWLRLRKVVSIRVPSGLVTTALLPPPPVLTPGGRVTPGGKV